jgi:ketosteroid isomerase-like protein
MRFTRWSGALAVAAVTLAACQKAETPEQATSRMQAEADSARPAITAQNARWMRYANANQVDSIVELYTTDAVLLPPDMPAATDRAGIKARLAATMVPGGVITLTTVGLTANGPLAVERGTWTFAIPAQGKTPAAILTGKFLVHWRKVDGQWLFAEDIWNNDAPMAPPPPAARQSR